MKKYVILFLFLLVACYNVYPQGFCGTSPKYVNTLTSSNLSKVSSNAVTSNCTGINVNLRFHIIRNTNGTGGYPLSVVSTILNNLANVYNKWGIYFVTNNPTDVINNDTYSSNWDSNSCSNTKFNDLVQVNRDNTAINIYILDANTWNQGLAEGIPGRAVVIGGKLLGVELVTSLGLAHELGHCLNLFHTHHGCESTDCNNNPTGVCLELPNGTNGATCGDFIADTPADPFIHFNTTSTCTWNGTIDYSSCVASGLSATDYHPDATNIMAYVPLNCMAGFTEGQANRMRAELLRSGSILNAVTTTFNNIPNLASASISLNGSTVTGPTPVTNGTYNLYVNLQANPNSVTYSYSVVGGSGTMNVTLNPTSGGNCQINVSGGTGSKYIRITTSNLCGSVTRDIVIYSMAMTMIAPNPASTSLSVLFDNTEYLLSLPDQIILYNEKSVIPLQTITVKDVFERKDFQSGNRIDFDISKLTKGAYYIRVVNGREVEGQQIKTTRVILQ